MVLRRAVETRNTPRIVAEPRASIIMHSGGNPVLLTSAQTAEAAQVQRCAMTTIRPTCGLTRQKPEMHSILKKTCSF